MHCPRITELPPPPPGRTGWPWTEETPPLPGSTPTNSAWASISIVTPSFNQGTYLEETIRSILLQGYPNLEYIVIDGGSTDNSIAVIKKYERWLTHWVSERDRGQPHAINKGLTRCTGAIFQWINSDDYLSASALGKIATALQDADAVAGIVVDFDEAGPRPPVAPVKIEAEKLIYADATAYWHQPGVWMRRESVTACGGIDEFYHYSFDWDLTIRYLGMFPRVNYITDELVYFRLHPQSKTVSNWERFMQERYRILQKLAGVSFPPAIRRASDRQIRYLGWREFVAGIRDNHRQSRLSRALRLGAAAFRDPQTRLTRFTLGAIRRVLFPPPAALHKPEASYEPTR